MAISPTSSNALNGINRGLEGLRQNAAEIAGANKTRNESPADLAEPLVGTLQNTSQVQASVKVLSAENRLIGTLLDVVA